MHLLKLLVLAMLNKHFIHFPLDLDFILFKSIVLEHLYDPWSYIWISSGEIKSVYVRNLPSTVSASEIAKEFKNFGRVKPDGVVIRNRKVHSLLLLSNFMLEFLLKCNYTNTYDMTRTILVFAMHLLNMKTFLVFRMQSRSVYISENFWATH